MKFHDKVKQLLINGSCSTSGLSFRQIDSLITEINEFLPEKNIVIEYNKIVDRLTMLNQWRVIKK